MKDGGPAFPRPFSEDKFNEEQLMSQTGMSLRDWFAGRAMQSLLSQLGQNPFPCWRVYSGTRQDNSSGCLPTSRRHDRREGESSMKLIFQGQWPMPGGILREFRLTLPDGRRANFTVRPGDDLKEQMMEVQRRFAAKEAA